MEIYTLDVYKTTESLVIKGFSAIQNLLRHNLGFQNCIKDGKNIEPACGSGGVVLDLFPKTRLLSKTLSTCFLIPIKVIK
jgi:uncharacterized protein YebE (UPF0316 family)